jgi:hypothetical protein
MITYAKSVSSEKLYPRIAAMLGVKLITVWPLEA